MSSSSARVSRCVAFASACWPRCPASAQPAFALAAAQPGDTGWAAGAGPEVEEQIAYMERVMVQKTKEAIEAKKELTEEKLAMSKATREWQEDWTNRIKNHHFEAAAHTDDLDRHRTQNEESSAELSTLRTRVSELERELAKERQDYKDLKKEAGTTLRFLQKERNMTRTLKDEKAAMEAEGKEAAAKLSEAQAREAESQQSDREQMLEVKIEDLQQQLEAEAQMSALWRDKHDKAVEERAHAVDLLNSGGEGAAGSGTVQQMLSAKREVEELKRQIEELQTAATAASSSRGTTIPAEPEPEPQAPAAVVEQDDPAALARAAQLARRTRLDATDGSTGNGAHAPSGGAAPRGGGSVEDVLLRARELRLRLSETDPRKLRQNLGPEIRQSVEDDVIVELSQRRVDAVIQQIIRVQTGGGGGAAGAGGEGGFGGEGADAGGGLAIREEDMSLVGVENYVHELWIELLDVLRDNADLRKNNLILHHERQQEVARREHDLYDRMQQHDNAAGAGAGAAGGIGGEGGGGGGGMVGGQDQQRAEAVDGRGLDPAAPAAAANSGQYDAAAGGGGGGGAATANATLSRASTAPAGAQGGGGRRVTAPGEYGTGMTGYVRRCYAECEDQSA
jgi:hypothetical protein